LLEVGSGDGIGEVPGDPGVGEGLLDLVPARGFVDADLLQQVPGELGEVAVREVAAREVLEFVLVAVFVLALDVEGVVAADEFVHDEACGPQVHRLRVRVLTQHLLRRLIHQRPASVVYPPRYYRLNLNRQPKVHQLHRRKVLNGLHHDVARLDVSVHQVKLVDVLQTQ